MFDLEYIKAMPFFRGNYRARMRAQAERRRKQEQELLAAKLLSTNGVQSAMDVHFWCVDQNGECQDPYEVPLHIEVLWGPWDEYFDPPLKLERLAWNETPSWVSTMPAVQYKLLKKEVHRLRQHATSVAADDAGAQQVMRRILADASKTHQQQRQSNCLTIAAAQHALHGWPVLVGSLGFQSTTDGVTEVHWEHGNGLAGAPAHFQ